MDYIISTDKSNVPAQAMDAVMQEYFYKFVIFLWVYVQLGVLIWEFHVIGTESLKWLE